jgi:IS30 family transposase
MSDSMSIGGMVLASLRHWMKSVRRRGALAALDSMTYDQGREMAHHATLVSFVFIEYSPS